MALNITLREASTDDILNCSQTGSSSTGGLKKKNIQPLTNTEDLLKMVPSDIDITKPVVDSRDIPPPKIVDVPKVGSVEGEVVLKPCRIPRVDETVPIGSAETSSQRKSSSGRDGVATTLTTTSVSSSDDRVREAVKTLSGGEVKEFKILTYDVIRSYRNNKINITFSEELKYKEQLNFFEIDPPLEGDQYWLGKKTLVFSPTQRFAKSTSFKCKIKKGILSKSGKRLPEDYTFDFATERISLCNFIPTYRHKVHAKVPFYISFNQRIDQEKVFSLLKLTSRLSVQNIPLKIIPREEVEPRLEKLREISMELYKTFMYEFEHQSQDRSFWFCGEEDLELSTSYTLEVQGELTSLEGPLVRQVEREYTFSTFPQFCVKGSSNDVLPLQRFRVWFNNKIDRSTFDPKKMVKVSPAITDLEVVPSEKSLYISGKTEGNTMYSVTIKKGVKDVYGTSLKKGKKLRVMVTRAAQTLQAFRSGLVVLDPTHPQSTCFNLVVCNVKAVRMTVFKVSPKDFKTSPLGTVPDDNWLKKRRGATKTINLKIIPDNPTEVSIDLLPYLPHRKEGVGHLYIVIKPVKTKDSTCEDEVEAWVQVTKLAFDMFTAHDGKMYAYSNSLETGKVVENAKFTYIPHNEHDKKKKLKPIHMEANEFGLVSLEPSPDMLRYSSMDGFLVCSSGKDSVFTSNLPRILGKPRESRDLHFIFDDRKLYKPKEDVHIKGFFRKLVQEGPVYRIEKMEDQDEVKYKVFDGRKEEFLSSTTKIENGMCHVTFKIPPKPNLGKFTITFEISEERKISHIFKCEMFRTPEFFVRCKSDQSYYVVKDDFVVKSLARYYSGGPLGDSSVQWAVSQKRAHYTPPGLSQFKFECDRPTFTDVKPTDVKMKGTSNIDGEHNLCVSTVINAMISQEEKYQPVSVTTYCHVQDLNKQTISGSKKFTIHPCSLYIGVNCPTIYETLGKKVQIDVVVCDINGKSVKNARFSVFVKRRENINLWTKRYQLKHAYHFESDTPHKTIELPFTNDGSYRLIFKVFDDKERSNACSQRLHIFDPNKKYQSRDLDSSFDLGKKLSKRSLMILPNKTKFNVGENCRLLMDLNPLTPPVTCYLHIYASGIVRKELLVINAQTEIYNMKIFKEYVPNISVELYAVGNVSQGENKRRPAFASQKVDLEVTLAHSELSVELSPESEVVRPGSLTKVLIRIFPKFMASASEKEFQSFEDALATVIVVDEAVLNLANYRIKNPIRNFFPSHTTTSNDCSTRTDVFLKKWEDIELKAPAPPTVSSYEMRVSPGYRTLPMAESRVTEHVTERVRNVFKIAPSTPHFRPLPPKGEVLTIQVGQCGNQIGEEFWSSLMKEHDLDERGRFTESMREGNEGMAIYFRELSKSRNRMRKRPGYYPRALLIDTDPSIVDGIRSRKFGSIFRPQNCITSSLPTGNNWAKGHYTDGAEMVDTCLDAMRRECEAVDCLDGFHLFHSIGGGTGGGLGTLMLSKVREEFPDRMMSTVTVLPSCAKFPGAAVEPYNATLSVHQLVENADMCFLYHNERLYETCRMLLGEKQPQFLTINSIVARSLSDVTSCFRYPGYLNSNMRKMSVNLVPFPRLHFIGVHTSPINAYGHYTYPNVREVTMNLFSASHCMANYDVRHGRYTTCAAIYRGGGSQGVIEEELLRVQNRNSSYFVEWIPNNCNVSMIPYTRDNKGQISAGLISNSTAVQEPFKQLSEYFTAMFRRKAFLHWYTGEGMDEMEFTEAESNMNDLISEYQQYQDATADEDGELEEGEEEEEGFEDEMMMDEPPEPAPRKRSAVPPPKKSPMKSPQKKKKKKKSVVEKEEKEKEVKKKDEKKKEVKLRKDFRALAAYVDLVNTDKSGVAEVPIQIPDNLTRFRVTVLANRGNEQFGLGETVIRTNLPFTIKPSPPRFARLSDVFICPVVIQNQHSKAVDVRVAVQSSSNFNTPNAGFFVEKLGSKERAVLPVQVRVDELGPGGEGKLRFVGEARVIGESNTFVDAVEKKVPIQLPHTVEHFSVSGRLGSQEPRVVQPIEFEKGLSLLPDETNCSFRVSTSAVSCLADSFEYVCNYKFLCCEQTSSQILSLVSLLDIRSRFYTPPPQPKKSKGKKKKSKKYGYVLPSPTAIRENVKTGLMSLVKKQGVTGGFGFWGRSSMHPTATTHAGLAVMRVMERDDPKMPLPPMMLKKLVDCLSNFRSLLKKDKYLSGRTTDELISVTYFLLSIYHSSKSKKKSPSSRILGPKEISKLVFDMLKKKDRSYLTHCYCVLALSKLGRKKHGEMIRKEVSNLVMFVQEEKNSAFVVQRFEEDDYNTKMIALASSGKVNALLLEVLSETGIPEHEELAHKIARYLLNKRGRKNSRWGNTHLCCHCNIALNKYYLRYEKDNEGVDEFVFGFENSQMKVELEMPKTCEHSATIKLGTDSDKKGEEEEEGESDADEDGNDEQLMAVIQRTKGTSSLFYSMSFRYVIANLITPKVDDRGFSLKRVYHPVDYSVRDTVTRDRIKNEWVVKNGSIIKIELVMYTPSTRYHVALVDSIPAGFEIMNPEFSVIPKKGANKYRHVWYSHQNMRDDSIEVFAEHVSRGVSYYVYFARATACGRFLTNPAYCEEMYDEAVFGRTETEYVRIVNE